MSLFIKSAALKQIIAFQSLISEAMMSLFIKVSVADRVQARPGDRSPPSRRLLAVSAIMQAMMSLFIKTFNLLPAAGGEVDFDGPYPAKDGGGNSSGSAPSVIRELRLLNATSPFVPNREEIKP